MNNSDVRKRIFISNMLIGYFRKFQITGQVDNCYYSSRKQQFHEKSQRSHLCHTVWKFSKASIQVESYYFKKNSTELTSESQEKFNDFISTWKHLAFQILELSSYAEKACADFAKPL